MFVFFVKNNMFIFVRKCTKMRKKKRALQVPRNFPGKKNTKNADVYSVQGLTNKCIIRYIFSRNSDQNLVSHLFFGQKNPFFGFLKINFHISQKRKTRKSRKCTCWHEMTFTATLPCKNRRGNKDDFFSYSQPAEKTVLTGYGRNSIGPEKHAILRYFGVTCWRIFPTYILYKI